jgi:hypothetical protein
MKRVYFILIVLISIVSVSCKKVINYGSINGIVQNLINNQVAYLEVDLIKNGSTIKKTVTDMDGKFNFFKIESGNYVVSIIYDNTLLYDSVLVQEEGITQYTFEIAYRSDILGWVFLPAPVSTVGAKNIYVELMQGASVLQSVFTDNSGKYILKDVKQGYYILRFSGVDMFSSPQRALRTITYGFTLNKNTSPIVNNVTMILAP